MDALKHAVIMLAFLAGMSAGVFADEPKKDAKTDAKAEAPAPAADAKQAVGKPEHTHVMGAEKRFVAKMDADGVQRAEMTGGEYFFDPNYIVLKVNVPVELKIKKAPGYVPHDIVVDAPDAGIKFTADLGKDWQVIKFTPTKVGKYEMVCDKKLLWFKSHKDRGMDGFIEVVP